MKETLITGIRHDTLQAIEKGENPPYRQFAHPTGMGTPATRKSADSSAGLVRYQIA
jgi:hypothetical protein